MGHRRFLGGQAKQLAAGLGKSVDTHALRLRGVDVIVDTLRALDPVGQHVLRPAQDSTRLSPQPLSSRLHTMIDLADILGFDWDQGNARKNDKHGVSSAEGEQVFFNDPLLLLADDRHSDLEPRFHALGKTDTARLLHITFTIRDSGRRIRVISARDMHRKERAVYERSA